MGEPYGHAVIISQWLKVRERRGWRSSQHNKHQTICLVTFETPAFIWFNWCSVLERLGASLRYHSWLLLETGSCPVQPQSFTGCHWELPWTNIVFCWWAVNVAQCDRSVILLDTRSCPVQPVFYWWTELPSLTIVYYQWKLDLQSTTNILLLDTESFPVGRIWAILYSWF